MPLFLITSLLIAGWFLVNFLRFKKLVTISEGIQTVAPYEQYPENAKKSLLVAGDSTAVGTGSLEPKLSVAGRIGNEFPDVTITNLSKNGRKTGELIPILKDVEGKHYNAILLQIGGNDIIRFVSLPQVKSDIDELLVEAKKLSPEVVLVTSGDVGEAPFFPRPLNLFWTKRTQEVRNIFRQSAKEHDVVYIDLLGLGVDGAFRQDINKFYSPDLLHPSADGYGVWYSHIGPVISEVLNK